MLKIRLSRIGKKHAPHYRIVVSETRSKRNGRVVASIGHWHPQEEKLILDKKAVDTWITKGARPTEAIRNLYAKTS